jgi:lipopolysaccharide/colanic/teichoic acid biosynthesis glycosyltransferase
MNRMKFNRRADLKTSSRSRVRPNRKTKRPNVQATAPDAATEQSPLIRQNVYVHRVDAHQTHDRVKRAFDLFITILIALPVSVIVFLTAALIRLTSKGPAIYTQERLGRFGRVFTIYKLRTMNHNCEAKSGAQWSTKGDTRITRLGKILRMLHIDELPQLYNVWKGEMSLVGPRPERPEIVTSLRPLINGYDRRLEVLPGVTGLAQVHLPPDETMDCVRRKLVFDRTYVRFISLWMDVKILMLTAMKVCGMRRFYARTLKN